MTRMPQEASALIVHEQALGANAPTPVQPSKHAYSRLAPLTVLHRDINFVEPPATFDADVVDQVVKLSRDAGDGPFVIPAELAAASRSVVTLVPALAVRHRSVTLPQPGGCAIGARRIDLYLQIIAAFGARIDIVDGATVIERGLLRPASIVLPFPSFNGTATALIIAATVDGVSRIRNASIEPETIDLANALRISGVQVDVDVACRSMTVHGHGRLLGQSLQVSACRNVLVTRIAMALIQELPFTYVSDTDLQLEPLYEVLMQLGVSGLYGERSVVLNANPLKDLRPVCISAGHYPAFASDWQPLIAPVLARVPGRSQIRDLLFEKRYDYVHELRKINPRFHAQQAAGVLELVGATSATSPASDEPAHCLDLRAGAALLIAALGEQRASRIVNVHQLRRGYRDIAADAAAVGRRRATWD